MCIWVQVDWLDGLGEAVRGPPRAGLWATGPEPLIPLSHWEVLAGIGREDEGGRLDGHEAVPD